MNKTQQMALLNVFVFGFRHLFVKNQGLEIAGFCTSSCLMTALHCYKREKVVFGFVSWSNQTHIVPYFPGPQ